MIGCIDGTHTPICPPAASEYIYRNRKSTHSINVQVICDAANIITDIVAKFLGSTHDSYIFHISGIYTRLAAGEFGERFLLGKSL